MAKFQFVDQPVSTYTSGHLKSRKGTDSKTPRFLLRFYYEWRPRFVSFCHDLPFWPIILDSMCLKTGCAKRGKTRQIAPLQEGFLIWLKCFLFATAGYSFLPEPLVFTGLPGNPDRNLGHFWDNWRSWYSSEQPVQAPSTPTKAICTGFFV